ncbi:MAG: hypothetical protein A2812_02465 [Candidatus Staskawiczbacteria bacterium RIFCSPHIGHO2_01_FULL_36_16]|uniref:Uncharacterized protein n=1 Tax=Candidatus Staskawiczbacteria bacterium RIFCSPHIGHO2_01_FULL_36_16 TaxID=1802200 RepID=A0A1G2HL47_9BACT|nr:MAG: hypothetical protein A2812_02465 [Candidatus Staskawiczbacteria bacterium RIFCSPHIGHO2_01_FULL_36_16]
MIKFLIPFFLVSIAFSLIYLNFVNANVQGGLLFSIFVVIAMVERIWETFFTPKDKNVLKFRGDWTLLATTSSYFIVSLIMIFGFFSSVSKNYFFVVLGLVIFLGSFLIRWWSMKSLKNEWTIHLNDSKNKNPVLIRTGPYKYIRHPIYLTAILDLIGLAFISNFYFGIIIIALINVPLFVWRSLYEEKINMAKFSEKYALYKKETSFMIPWKLLNTK